MLELGWSWNMTDISDMAKAKALRLTSLKTHTGKETLIDIYYR